MSPDAPKWFAAAVALLGAVFGVRKIAIYMGEDHMMSPVAQSDPSQVPATGVAGVNLGQYFTLTEFVASDTARKRGIDNTPTPQAIVAMRALVANVLDPLRIWLGVPIRISSGYRSPALNTAVDGSDTSQHMSGEGVDIIVHGLTSGQLAAKILKAQELGVIPGWDQAIHYRTGYKPHVHISWNQGPQRNLVTYAPSKGVYQHGVLPTAVA